MLSFKPFLRLNPGVETLLKEYVDQITDPTLRDLAYIPLNDPRFWKSPAAAKKHHAYPGGLSVHTLQVLELTLRMLEVFANPRVNETVVALIWHDYAKIWDYREVTDLDVDARKKGDSYIYTDHAGKIGHLPRSYGEMLSAAKALQVPEETIDFIGHLMLAHHGRKEWNSPVLPAETEAWCIHAADMISAQYSTDAHIPPNKR